MVDDVYKKLSEERKQLQEEGRLPEWISTSGWQLFKEKYLYDAADFKEQAQRIAKTAAQHLGHYASQYESQFFDIIWKGWLSCSTPVLSNMGTNRGLPVSCSGQYIEDSIDGFYSARYETAILTKHGFGTAGYFGDVRSRGSDISVGGKASGAVPVFKGFIQDMRDVSQGSVRRGSFAGYFLIDGDDFFELINFVENNPDDCNVGWVVSDKFIERLQNNDKDAIERYQKTLKVKMVTGKGYFFFVDKANRARPQWYKDNNLDIKSSQLCVTGDQLVVSDRGLVSVKQLYCEGGDLTLFDNNKAVKASPMQLVEKDADVYEVTLSNGLKHKVTSYHKIQTKRGMVECSDLKLGDKVYFQTNKGIFGSIHKPKEAFLLGLYQSDGTSHMDTIMIDIWDGKTFDLEAQIKDHVDYVCDTYGTQSTFSKRVYPKPNFVECAVCESVTGSVVRKKRLGTNSLSKALNFQKGYIPDWVLSGDEVTQWEYVKGLFYCDGTVSVSETGKGNPIYLSISNTNREFLEQLQLMCLNLGIRFALSLSADERVINLPNGKGEYAPYKCNPCYRLVCGNKTDALKFEKGTGFLSRKGVIIEDRQYRDNTKKTHPIVKIECKGKEDVYCTTVDSKEHLWVCNGFITSNCNEIMLHSSKDYTYTCVLSSANLAKRDEWKDTNFIQVATLFLWCVAKEFISKAKGIKGLEKAVAFTERSMALGLGVCGLHTLFQMKGVPFESFEAHRLNVEIFKELDEQSLLASQWLAATFGEPEWCKGYGVGVSHRIAIAPTKSTALIMGGVSEGINPDPAMVFTQSTAGGEMERINPILLNLMKEKGIFTKKHVQEIIDEQGSVQKVNWLTDEEKAVFKTAFEIDQRAILRLASVRGQWIDQWQSLNLFFSSEEDEEYISQVHKEAFLDERILGLYYIYSKAGVQGSKDTCEACM